MYSGKCTIQPRLSDYDRIKQGRNLQCETCLKSLTEMMMTNRAPHWALRLLF